MNQQRLIIFIAAFIGIISLFFSWVTFSFESTLYSGNQSATNSGDIGFSGLGMVVFICNVVCIVLSLIADKSKPFDKKSVNYILIAGLIGLSFTILHLGVNIAKELKYLRGYDVNWIIPGIGGWLSLFASSGIIASTWYFKKSGNLLEEGFKTLKNKITSNTFTIAPVSNNISKEYNAIEEIEKLFQMKEKGIISDENFKLMKEKTINSN